MSGYIKLFRSVRHTAIAQHPEYFAAWCHLLLMASYTHREQLVGSVILSLEPGQLVFGRTKFSAMTGISENKTRSALDVMKRLSMITIKSHSKFSIITITNWSLYQGESPADHQQTTSKPPADHHNKEGSKKGEKEKKEHVGLKPDIMAEVIDYLNERAGRKYRNVQTHANHINARLEEGATLEDFKAVIDRKCEEWKGDPKFDQYLRPATLFNAEKFNNYLGQVDSPIPLKDKEVNQKRIIRDFPTE